MMQKYGGIIHNIQRMLKLPLTQFDIAIGDEYEDDNCDASDDDDDNSDYYGGISWFWVVYS